MKLVERSLSQKKKKTKREKRANEKNKQTSVRCSEREREYKCFLLLSTLVQHQRQTKSHLELLLCTPSLCSSAATDVVMKIASSTKYLSRTAVQSNHAAPKIQGEPSSEPLFNRTDSHHWVLFFPCLFIPGVTVERPAATILDPICDNIRVSVKKRKDKRKRRSVTILQVP